MNLNTRPGTGQEDRFEDRLLTAILADFDHLSTSGAQLPSRSRTRRLTLTLGTAAVATAVGAAAVFALAGHTPAGHAPGRQTPTAAGTSRHRAAGPKIVTAAFVVRQMTAALNANTAIMYTLEHAPNSQTGRPVVEETWAGHGRNTSRTVMLNASGQPLTGYLLTIDAHRTISIKIDYAARTWSRTVYPFGSVASGSAPQGPAPLPVSPSRQAASLREGIRSGRVVIAGRTVIDGQPTLELRQGSLRRGLLETWVSTRSYLPLRQVAVAAGQRFTSPSTIRDDYKWLPATPANLRLLTAAGAIPPGFTQVPSHH
jgi:hypothetical protein